MRRVLVVNPTSREHAVFAETCTGAGWAAAPTRLGRLDVLHWPELGLMAARGGLGKAQLALQTQHLLDHGRDWEAVICAGTGGSLDDSLQPGAVVVGEVTIEHDYTNRFTVRPLPRFPADPGLLAALRQAATAHPHIDVYFGPIASGDEDIISTTRRHTLRTATGALAVAWEGAGAARAAAFNGLPYVEIRGVSDGADDTAPTDFEIHLAAAMQNVAALILAWRASQ